MIFTERVKGNGLCIKDGERGGFGLYRKLPRGSGSEGRVCHGFSRGPGGAERGHAFEKRISGILSRWIHTTCLLRGTDPAWEDF